MVLAIVVGGVVVLAAVVLYWEVYFYEGVHLGPRIQSRLYDQWADSYDRDKEESQARDAELLAAPLLEALEEDQPAPAAPLVLDVATGTGRLPAALLSEPDFGGRVIGLDISQGMLVQAAEKLAPYGQRVTLVHHAAETLPFPDDAFDVVSCLEALELMPAMEAPLAELARVLRPGGVLLTSRGREASRRVGQVRSAQKFTELLHHSGFVKVRILPWWKMFDRVWARKPGRFSSNGARGLADVLRCPACGQVALTALPAGGLRCRQCEAQVPVGPQGIVLYDAGR